MPEADEILTQLQQLTEIQSQQLQLLQNQLTLQKRAIVFRSIASLLSLALAGVLVFFLLRTYGHL